jgi:hypothetical protein
MNRTTLFTVAGLFAAATASAVGLGIDVHYLLGVPVGEAKVTEATYWGSYTADVDTKNGLPLKTGFTNFGVGAVVGVVPTFGLEGGFEMYLKYNNKEAVVLGTIKYGDYGDYFSDIVDEDQVKWKMNNLYAGARFNLPFRGFVKAYADGGFLLIMGKGIALVDGEETDDYVKGTNMGVYFGVGTNIFFSRKFAINLPVKYNMPFAGTYKVYENGGENPNYEGKLKPPGYFTIGFGTELSLI